MLCALAGFCARSEPARSQTSSSGARAAALAGASPSSDLWSEANPAGWSRLKGFGAGLHVAELYGLDELRLGAVQASVGIRETALVAGVRTIGFEDYRQTVLTAGAARSVRWGTHRALHGGLRLRIHYASIRGYGSTSAYAMTAGAVVPIIPGTEMGLAAENVIVFGGGLKDDLPRRLHFGLSVSARSVTLLAGASKDVRTPLAAQFGAELHPVEVLALRAGYSVAPPRFAGGIGLRLHPLTVDIAAERHFALGWTPSCSLGLQW